MKKLNEFLVKMRISSLLFILIFSVITMCKFYNIFTIMCYILCYYFIYKALNSKISK